MNLYETDPEFMARCQYFAGTEVVQAEGAQLETPTRYMAVLAALLGAQGLMVYQDVLARALTEGAISPVVAKEIVYQAVPYLGLGRVAPFLSATNEVLIAQGVELPLDNQATTTLDDRLLRGEAAQVAICGEMMRNSWQQGIINRWLADNCFGDYYTRTGLELRQREILTFCYLMALGGCEAQLAAHVQGNINVGNDGDFLMRVVLQCVPYIGYPRSLNAINCIQQVIQTT